MPERLKVMLELSFVVYVLLCFMVTFCKLDDDGL